MLIRQEMFEDYQAVYQLVTEACASAAHKDGNEQNLVNALRKGEAFIPELSLVAKVNQELIGHIMFSKAKVGDDEVLVLAPLSVKPLYQRQGVGTALIKKDIKSLKN